MKRGPKPKDPQDRFFTKLREANGCWEWTAALSQGYGVFRLTDTRTNILAHRWAWMFFRGPVPDGLDLDHLCRNRACVNPDHLEPVSRAVNLHRGEGLTGVNHRKTCCPKGHPYDVANTYVTKLGHRSCRACSAGRYHRSKEAS